MPLELPAPGVQRKGTPWGPARYGRLQSIISWADREISDSFTKREKANEDFYVKKQEREKLVLPIPPYRYAHASYKHHRHCKAPDADVVRFPV